jgi:hypothetical protein
MGAAMTTIGELKKAIAEKPDDMPLSLNYIADDGEVVKLRIAEAWTAQGSYCVEFEAPVTEEMLNEHP